MVPNLLSNPIYIYIYILCLYIYIMYIYIYILYIYIYTSEPLLCAQVSRRPKSQWNDAYPHDIPVISPIFLGEIHHFLRPRQSKSAEFQQAVNQVGSRDSKQWAMTGIR